MTRLYQLALRAFPRRHRDLYGVEMIDAFDRELTARAGRARLSFGFAACLNAIGTGLVERQRQRRIRKGPAFSALDFTLAWRMLLRYPGLSLVSVLGMSVGITIAAGAFTIVSMMMGTTLPLPEGDRLVSLVNWDASTNNRELRLLYDLEAWRDAKSIEDFSVSRNVQRNLIVGGRPPEVVMVAEISASAFRAARVGAYRGRTLLPEDERAGAPDAIVIGHDEWVRRFGADPDIVGQSVGLGPTAYTIVGVMPEGFGFPTYHSFWIPWRLDAAAYAPRSGPSINVFGRLAPGATLESARAELTAISRRLAAASPATHEHLRPLVIAYAHAFSDMDDPRGRARGLRDRDRDRAVAGPHLRQRRHPRLRADGDAARRDRGARGARRQPAPDCGAAVRRSADAGRRVGGDRYRAHRRRAPSDRGRDAHPGRPLALLVLAGASHQYRDLRRRADTARGGHRRRGAGAQGDRAARSTRGCKRFRLAADRACRWGGCGRR